MKQSIKIFASIILLGIITGCFKDLGNYDYTAVNDIVISDKGFDKPYDVRRDYEPFSIKPEISFSNDPEGKGTYEYEWVAVGQNLLKGKRFTIGTEKDLYCPKLLLEAEEYILYLKVKDVSTDLVFSKSVSLTVKAATTEGWLLAGEHGGKGQVDMISFSEDILYLHDLLKPENGLEVGPINLVWLSNDNYSYDNRIFTGSTTGAHRFDRETFAGNEQSSLKSSFVFPPENAEMNMTACYDIDGKRHIIIVDSLGYEMKHGMIGNTFCTYDQLSDFRIAGEFIYNLSFEPGHARLMCVFYNTKDKEFSIMPNNISSKLDRDLWSWSTKDVCEDGLEMVTAINSYFYKGLGIAVMKDAAKDEYYLYEITIPSYGYPSKDKTYKVDKSIAEGFETSPSYIISSYQGYIVYASGNKLYGYDYNAATQKVELLHEFSPQDKITCIKADYESDPVTKDKDYFLVATYDDSQERSGKVYKFQIKNDPDRMQAQLLETWDKGFLKIHSICYKAF